MTLPEPVHGHAAAAVVFGRTGYVLVIGGGKLVRFVCVFVCVF